MKPLVFAFGLVLGLCTGCGTGFMGLETVQSHYARYSTPELQLKHNQCVDYLNRNTWEFHFGMMSGDGNRQDRIKEKENLETELLRRYTAGDKQAYLPIFDATK